MPTISNALLRDPSFPLIVPLAEWMTPQVTKNFKFENSLPPQQQQQLTVGPWADVKNGFTWKIIIVLKVRGGHGE